MFEQFFKIIFNLENISTDTIYIDGTKIGTYANKYTFVWRGSIEKYSLRLDEKIETLISNFNNDFNADYESFLEICAYLSRSLAKYRLYKEEDTEIQLRISKIILKVNVWK